MSKSPAPPTPSEPSEPSGPSGPYKGSHIDALVVKCRLCSAEAEAPCTYIWPKGVNPDPTTPRSQVMEAKIARVGQVTQRPHDVRVRDAEAFRLRHWVHYSKYPRYSKYEPPPPPECVPEHILVAAKAMLQWEYRQHVRLCRWFRENSGLFTRLNNPAREGN